MYDRHHASDQAKGDKNTHKSKKFNGVSDAKNAVSEVNGRPTRQGKSN